MGLTISTETVERLALRKRRACHESCPRRPGDLDGRECLDHVVVLSERHLQRILQDYFSHHHRWRCQQSLEMDCPEPRPVQPPELGELVAIREAGGLYRHYERLAA
jgi:hypothetical protein